MYERPDALATLLATIDQEVDPYQSTRVARALKRVVVRDLDQRVSGALLLADQDMHNATTGRDWRGSYVPSEHLVVLADSLAVLRPDGRSRCLAGCARIVAQRFDSASSLLGEELARGHRGLLRGWLSLNLGAAQEKRNRLHDAHAAYTACGEHREHPSSVPAATFALFVSLRTGANVRAARDLRTLLDRDSGALHEALRGLRIHYAARFERSACDPLASVRSSLVRLGSAGAHIESELQLTASTLLRYFEVELQTLIGAVPSEPLCRAAATVAQQVSMPCAAPGTGAGGVPTQINTAADRRQRGPVPPI